MMYYTNNCICYNLISITDKIDKQGQNLLFTQPSYANNAPLLGSAVRFDVPIILEHIVGF